jgi:hypothetical protein
MHVSLVKRIPLLLGSIWIAYYVWSVDVIRLSPHVCPVAHCVEPCQYGTAPGSWDSSSAEGSRWQLLGTQCQLHNLLQQRSHPETSQPLKVLALSDSVDRYLMQFTCSHLNGTYTASLPPPDQPQLNKTAYLLHRCLDPRIPLKLASTYIPGVHPDGPYHKDIAQNYKSRMEFAKEHWEAYAGGPPDVVIVAANLWDIARMYGYERDLLLANELSTSTMQQWRANFTAVVQYAKRTFPEVRLLCLASAPQGRTCTRCGGCTLRAF